LGDLSRLAEPGALPLLDGAVDWPVDLAGSASYFTAPTAAGFGGYPGE